MYCCIFGWLWDLPSAASLHLSWCLCQPPPFTYSASTFSYTFHNSIPFKDHRINPEPQSPAACHLWWIWPWGEEQSQDIPATPPSTCTTPWLQNSRPRLQISHLDWNFAPCSTTSRRASDQTLGDSFLPIVAHRLPLQVPDIHTRAQMVLSPTLCDEFWWLHLNGLCWEVFSNFASTTILFSAVIHQCCSAEVKLKMVSHS